MVISPEVSLFLGNEHAGIPTCEISYRKEDINQEVILSSIGDILDFYTNLYLPIVSNLHSKYLLNHDILRKERLHEGTANNKVLEPHLFSMVKFKTGYAFGNPIKYSQTTEIKDDSIIQMSEWDKENKQRSLDSQVGEWIYSVGVGYYFIKPTKTSEKDEKPYSVSFVEADRCFKVYSSFIGHEELFDVLVSPISTVDDPNIKYSIEIYSEKLYLNLNVGYGINPPVATYYNIVEKFDRPINSVLPLVEKKADNEKVGIVQLAESLQEAIDMASSLQLDNLADIVNVIYVFKNCTIPGKTPEEKSHNFKIMVQNGVLELNSPNNGSNTPSADFTTVSENLNVSGTLQLHDTMVQTMYDICGVPLASSSVSSGGDTGSARSLGNGWENAKNRLLDEINIMGIGDRELLEKKIAIIHNDVKYADKFTLTSGQIDIKYSPDVSDNILTKSQSFSTFMANGMPPKMALLKSQLSNDAESEGREIEEYKAKSAEPQVNTKK